MKTEIKDGGPAFPVIGMTQRSDKSFMGVFNNGMSLRNWFAGMALSDSIQNCGGGPNNIAQWAFDVADAMIAESEKSK